MLSFGVYLSLTFVRSSLSVCVSRSVNELEFNVGLCSYFLDSLAAYFIAFIDPAIDRRIIYNDFRNNPYLHFDTGLVPRTFGV